jgi:hypothetical protein
MSIEDFLANLIKIRVDNAPPTPAENYSVGTRRLGCDRNTYIFSYSIQRKVLLEENKKVSRLIFNYAYLFVNSQNI